MEQLNVDVYDSEGNMRSITYKINGKHTLKGVGKNLLLREFL